MSNATVSEQKITVSNLDLIKMNNALTSPVIETDDLLDWDVGVQIPPVRVSGFLRVRLEYAGRATPLPVDEPDAD